MKFNDILHDGKPTTSIKEQHREGVGVQNRNGEGRYTSNQQKLGIK